MIASAVLVLVICSSDGFASPASQPAYANGQYYAVPQQYLQNQPQYISAPPIPQAATPVYEGAAQQQYVQQRPPTQRVSQLLLPSAADRQVQKAAEQIAGPEYAQQVQIAQQQGLANQAIATAQRRAELQLRRAQLQAQQAQQAQQQAHQPQQQQLQQQQQQYIEVAPRPQYVQVQVPQQAQQAQQYQLQYEPVYPQPVQPKPLRAIPQQQQQQQQQQHGGNQLQRAQEPEEEHDNNSSYQFGFDVKDDLYTNYQNRKEQREGGKISGSYSVVDSDGFIRTVTYTADPKEGFKAEVVRKPTDIVVKIPQPKEQQPQEQHQQYIQEVSPQRYQQQPQQQQQQQKPNIVYQYQ